MPTALTIITPCLDSTPDALATIASVAAQRLPGHRIEQIVIGAASAVRRDLPAGIDASTIRWIDDPAIETIALINAGLAAATGDAVSWLLPGDLHFDDTLEIVARALAEHPQTSVLYGDAIEIDADGKTTHGLTSKPFRLSRLRRACFFSQPTVFVRRDDMTRAGGLDKAAGSWADYDLWLRLTANGGRFLYVPRLLAAERHATASTQPFRKSRSQDHAAAEELIALMARRRGTMTRGQAALLGLQRALRAIPAPAAPRDLQAAAYREARGILRQCHPGHATMPWEPLLLARRTARVVRHHIRMGGRATTNTVSHSQQMLRPKRLQMMRRRIHRLVHHAPRPLAIPDSYARAQPPHDPPLISIVTPSFNQASFLERTVRSVLDQGYPRLEYIVQDGGSTDGSVDVLRRYGDRLTAWDSRSDRGQAHAVNLGMQQTTGSIMAYLNSDDLLLPGSLAAVSRFFTDNPDIDVVYGHRVLIDDHDREIGRWILPPHDDEAIKYTDFIPQETMFWRRRAWDAVGGQFDESFRFALDWDIILRFRQAGLRFARLPRFLGAFRISAAQKTNSWWLPVGRREVDRLLDRVLGYTPDSSTIRRHIKGYMRQHYLYDKLYLLGLLRY